MVQSDSSQGPRPSILLYMKCTSSNYPSASENCIQITIFTVINKCVFYSILLRFMSHQSCTCTSTICINYHQMIFNFHHQYSDHSFYKTFWYLAYKLPNLWMFSQNALDCFTITCVCKRARRTNSQCIEPVPNFPFLLFVYNWLQYIPHSSFL